MNTLFVNKMFVGNTWDFSVCAADYSAAEGWALRLYLVPRFASPVQAPVVLDSVAAADGVSHRFQLSAAQTAVYKAGQYGFQTNVIKAAEVYTLDGTYWSGEVTLFPNPAQLAQGADTRSQAQKAVEDIRSALANVASLSANAATAALPLQISIGDRSTTYANPKEAAESLRAELNSWSLQLLNEQQVAAGRASGPLGRASYGVPN